MTIDALTQELIDPNAGQTDGGDPGEELTDVKVALHHHHLPMMADAEVINYDREARTIEPTDTIDGVADLLNARSE